MSQVADAVLRGGHVELPRGFRVPYEPFLGTIATSPEIEAIATLAYQLITHAGRLRVGNMVDPQYSVVAKIERRYLPERKDE